MYSIPLELEAAPLGNLLGQKNRTDVVCYPDLSPALLARVVAGLKATGDLKDEIKVKYGFIPKQTASPC